MLLTEFINQWNGRGADFDGAYGFQCADLVEFYNRDVVGAPRIGGNAQEFWGRASNYFYQKFINTLAFVPQAGDIAVWGSKIGPYGDVAICTGNGNWLWFDAFGQNYPYGSKPHTQRRSYYGIVGFLRPIKPVGPIVSANFQVRVDKPLAMVRISPNVSANLGGSQQLVRGDVFIAVALVDGDNVNGNNKWYKSAKGNYIWSGGLTRL